MANFDLMVFIQNNFPSIMSSVQLIASGVIAALYFTKKTRVESQTQEFEKMKAGLLQEALEDMVASHKITYTELYKIKNYVDIAKRADEFLESKGESNEIPKQNFDWHVRFFEGCGNISEEELQNYWARILAGEIIHPGEYSLRTLECLKNLSLNEALLFQKICSASYDMGKSVMMPQYDFVFDKYGITYDDIFRLEDCGLIKSDTFITGGFDVIEEYKILTRNSKQALMVKLEKDKNDKFHLEIPEYLFTQSGRELYKVIGCESNIEILFDELKELFPNCDFCIGSIVGREGDKLIVNDGNDDE